MTTPAPASPPSIRARDAPKSATSRISSLDFLKGFLMLWITYNHLGMYWGDGSWTSAWALVWMLLDWMGPVGFISFTIIGTMISIKRKVLACNTRGMAADSIKKFVYLFTIGEVMNIVIELRNATKLGPWHMLGMNMITAVAFAQLLVHVVMKLTLRQRYLLVLILLAIFPFLFTWSTQDLGAVETVVFVVGQSHLNTAPSIVYFILFDVGTMMPTYGWLVLTAVVTALFDGMLDAHVRGRELGVPTVLEGEGRRKDRLSRGKDPLIRLAISGLVLVGVATAAGGFLATPGVVGLSTTYINLRSPDVFRFWTLPGVPQIFLRHTPYYWIFNLGVVSLAFCACYKVLDRPGRVSSLPTRVEIFGQYSLSVFVYHHAFALIPLRVPLFWFIPVLLPLLTALVFAVQAWDARLGGVLSLEWGLRRYLAFIDWVQKKKAARANSDRAATPTCRDRGSSSP